MTRRIYTAALIAVAMVLSVLTVDATAQGTACGYDELIAGTCTGALEYPEINNIRLPISDEDVIGVLTTRTVTTVVPGTGVAPITVSVPVPQFTG